MVELSSDSGTEVFNRSVANIEELLIHELKDSPLCREADQKVLPKMARRPLLLNRKAK